MNRYVATFHTHLSAMMTFRALSARGVEARMAPVPRVLSADCGTCVFYTAENPYTDAFHRDYEAAFEQSADGGWRQVVSNDDAL